MGWFVGFDFDGCLHRYGDPIAEVIQIMRNRAAVGDMPIIVTARTPSHELPEWFMKNDPDRVCVWPFVVRHQLPVHGVVFCSHGRKLEFLTRMSITEHYDNSRIVVNDCNESLGSITRGYLVGDVK